MTNTFLTNFMQAAKKITTAERCMAVDNALEIQSTLDIDRAMVESTAFGEFALECLREAIQSKDIVITNNIITDPSDAPTTNTNFANLRVVVSLPLIGYGAIYLDQHIRNGIFPKQMMERLMRTANHVIDNSLENSSVEDLVALYNDL